jgi:DNA-directed RNA polymerase subunit beta'
MKKNKIYCNKNFNKNEIKKLIDWFIPNYGSIKTTKFLDKIKAIGFKYATNAGISIGIEDLKIPKSKEKLFKSTQEKINEIQKELNNGNINILDNTEKTTKYWNTTNEILKDKAINTFRETNLLNPVYMMTFSGARGNISQIKQLIGMRGLMSDSTGNVADLPIKSNLKEGLKIIEYFISCYGARKGLIDTALKTANSGYLTRKIIYASQNQIIKKIKCKSYKGTLVLNDKKSKNFYKITKEKILGRILSKDIKNKEKIIFSKGQDICNYVFKKIEKNKKIYIKSPLNCNLITGTCQLCYGWNLGNGRMIELGESIGILAAQSIGEPGTQLTMRTFHTGGIFSGQSEKTIRVPYNGILKYDSKKGGRKIKTKYGEKAFFTTEEKKIILKRNKGNINTIKIPKQSIIYIKNKDKVFSEQIIAETPKFKKIKEKKISEEKETQKIKTKNSGQIVMKNNKEKLWLVNGNIISKILLNKNFNRKKFAIKKFLINKNITKNIKQKNTKNKFNNIIKKTKNIKFLRIKNKKEEIYRTNKKINLEKSFLLNKKQTEKKIKEINNLLIGQFKYKNKDKDKICSQIIQKEKEIKTIRKTNTFLIYKNKEELEIKRLIKKESKILSIENKKQKTGDIVQGLPKINEIIEARKETNFTKNLHIKIKNKFNKLSKKYNNKLAVRKSIEKLQRYIIKNIQKVYIEQGVKISDKHMEIIVKEMTNKIIIKDKGQSNLIIGEIIEINKIEKINKNIKKKILYEPLILGISKISLTKESFISAACFQETTKIISKTAINGKIDWLYGLKENIILENMIPAGTNFKKFKV